MAPVTRSASASPKSPKAVKKNPASNARSPTAAKTKPADKKAKAPAAPKKSAKAAPVEDDEEEEQPATKKPVANTSKTRKAAPSAPKKATKEDNNAAKKTSTKRGASTQASAAHSDEEDDEEAQSQRKRVKRGPVKKQPTKNAPAEEEEEDETEQKTDKNTTKATTAQDDSKTQALAPRAAVPDPAGSHAISFSVVNGRRITFKLPLPRLCFNEDIADVYGCFLRYKITHTDGDTWTMGMLPVRLEADEYSGPAPTAQAQAGPIMLLRTRRKLVSGANPKGRTTVKIDIRLGPHDKRKYKSGLIMKVDGRGRVVVPCTFEMGLLGRGKAPDFVSRGFLKFPFFDLVEGEDWEGKGKAKDGDDDKKAATARRRK